MHFHKMTVCHRIGGPVQRAGPQDLKERIVLIFNSKRLCGREHGSFAFCNDCVDLVKGCHSLMVQRISFKLMQNFKPKPQCHRLVGLGINLFIPIGVHYHIFSGFCHSGFRGARHSDGNSSELPCALHCMHSFCCGLQGAADYDAPLIQRFRGYIIELIAVIN